MLNSPKQTIMDWNIVASKIVLIQIRLTLFLIAGRPGIFNMRDRAKWDAWKAVEGIELKAVG